MSIRTHPLMSHLQIMHKISTTLIVSLFGIIMCFYYLNQMVYWYN